MKIVFAIAGAVVGVCAAAGAVCFAKYAKTTDAPTLKGFFESAKNFCPCCNEDFEEDFDELK